MASLPINSTGSFNPLDLNELRYRLHKAVDFVADYYKNVESHSVLPHVQPGYIHHLLPADPPLEPASTFDEAIAELHRAVIPGMTHWANPNFFAYFPATLSSAYLAVDLVASALNPVASTWLSSPAATELEDLVLDWLAQLLRLPRCFCSSSDSKSDGAAGGGGVLLATTSEGILCTLIAARDVALRRLGRGAAGLSSLVAYGSDQTHSTFSKACHIAGFDPTNIHCVRTGPGQTSVVISLIFFII